MAKKIILLCLILAAATFCASAKTARKSDAGNGEIIKMKEKIICEPCQGKEKGVLRRYHYFKISGKKDILIIEYTSGPMEYIEKYLEFDASFHFPMEKIPDVVKTMTDAFYLCNPLEGRWGYTIALPDSKFRAAMSFNEMYWVMDEYSLVQDDGDKIWEDIDLYWDMETKSKVPLKGTRVMPKSLDALIKGLRDFYNEWQKDHPECEQLKLTTN